MCLLPHSFRGPLKRYVTQGGQGYTDQRRLAALLGMYGPTLLALQEGGGQWRAHMSIKRRCVGPIGPNTDMAWIT